jgi:hypothetical protein
MEHQVSLPCSQEPSSELVESSHTRTNCFGVVIISSSHLWPGLWCGLFPSCCITLYFIYFFSVNSTCPALSTDFDLSRWLVNTNYVSSRNVIFSILLSLLFSWFQIQGINWTVILSVQTYLQSEKKFADKLWMVWFFLLKIVQSVIQHRS